MPAVTGQDKHWPLFHFWRHHLSPKLAYPSSVARKNLSNDTQVRVIGLMEPEILHRKNWWSWWCFLRDFWTGSKPNKDQSLSQKDQKRRERKGKKNIKITKSPNWFLRMPKQKCFKTWWKEMFAIMFQRPFLQPPSRLELNNGPYLDCKSLKYPKMHIWQNAPGVNGWG